jgi:diadenosine tetraphosphate (Ap4A) HIT family hydrolase
MALGLQVPRCNGVHLFVADSEGFDHVHLHLLPRFAGDGFGLRAGPD